MQYKYISPYDVELTQQMSDWFSEPDELQFEINMLWLRRKYDWENDDLLVVMTRIRNEYQNDDNRRD